MSGSDVRLERAMSFSVIEGSLATVMSTLLGGIFLTGFALQLGANRLQVGIMAALPTLSQATQLIGVSFLNRTGRSKQMCMWVTWTARLMWIPILFVPWLFQDLPQETQAWIVIGLLAVASSLGALGGLAWLDWIKRLIPGERRVAFMARRNLYNSGLSMVMSLVAALMIWFSQGESSQSTNGFIAVFALAIGCGLFGAWLLGKIPPADSLETQTSFDWDVLVEPLRDRNFRSLLTGYAVWQFATQMALPFYTVYMLQKLHVPFWIVTALTTMGSLIALSLNSTWTQLKIRYGVRPVVLIATLGDLFLPFAWLMIHPQTIWLILPVHFFSAFNPPLTMGPQNFLLKIAPNRNSASYSALFNMANGGIGALGAVFGGWLAMILQGQWQVFHLDLTGIQLVFLLAGCGKFAGFLLLSQVHEVDATSVRDVVKQLPLPRARNAA